VGESMTGGNLEPRAFRALSSPWRVGAGLLLLLALGLGCSSSNLACDEGTCVAPDGGLDGTLPDGPVVPEASTDAKPDADPIPTDCTTPTDPVKNPDKCLVDSFGVFVSPTGDDTKDGSKANPFKTIGKALGTSRSRIVVCEGEYAGSLDVGRAVEIYGGVACDFAKAGAKAKIVASKPAYGLKVSKVTGAVILADLDVVGMNAAAPSESSVGVFASESANVKVLRSRVEAGDGADAPAKKDGAFAMAAQAPKGGDAVANTGGASASSGVCAGGGTSIGGKGGDLGNLGEDGSPRPPDGAKGPVGDCTSTGSGFPGTIGTSGTDRTGAATLGTITPDGISGSKGQDGAPGAIGGSGGGGFGFSGAGGAGGAGGCGGQGGFGGAAGGSSVALLVFASEVSLEGTELVAKNAKPGGAGGSGQAGQMGGFRGNGSGNACNGGGGAAGGTGGNAGGGAGGIAAGIVWSTGKEPKRDGATKITRPTSTAPAGGEGGGGAATKGIDGVHADVFEVK
jgi:hypothetical protein